MLLQTTTQFRISTTAGALCLVQRVPCSHPQRLASSLSVAAPAETPSLRVINTTPQRLTAQSHRCCYVSCSAPEWQLCRPASTERGSVPDSGTTCASAGRRSGPGQANPIPSVIISFVLIATWPNQAWCRSRRSLQLRVRTRAHDEVLDAPAQGPHQRRPRRVARRPTPAARPCSPPWRCSRSSAMSSALAGRQGWDLTHQYGSSRLGGTRGGLILQWLVSCSARVGLHAGMARAG